MLFRILAMLLLLITCTGCVPDVAWLPDSTGIVYTISDWPALQNDKDRKQDQHSWLMHYDLKTKTAREVTRIKGHTIRIAIRPNTQHIAMVESAGDSIQILLVDMQGKVVHRSKSFPWPKPDASKPSFVQLFWSPDGSKLLVSEQRSAIYDVKQDSILRLEAIFPTVFGNTPLTPDGQSFLAAEEKKGIYLVDWNGVKTPIETAPELLQGRNEENVLMSNVVAWSRWEGTTAVSLWRGKKASIDTVKKQATLREVDQAVWSIEGKEVQQQYQFPNSKMTIAVLFKASYRDFRDAGVQTCSVELLGPAPNQRKTLIATTFHCGVYPSPNQELAALRYTNDKAIESIMIIDKNGEIVANVSAEKK